MTEDTPINISMKLLIFAHRGEAQTFIHHLEMKPYPMNFNGVYKSEDYILCITGEGHFKALKKTSALLGHFQEITQILNLGIAGSLNGQIEIGSVVKVRTVYGFNSKPLFHSYTSQDGTVDCISSSERVLSDQSAQVLSHFANIVDRELWGMANACEMFSLPFHSLKYISDKAGSSTDCYSLKDKAMYFSEQLWKAFLAFEFPLANEEETKELITLDEIISSDYFHVTNSQSKMLESLIYKIKKRLQIQTKDLIQDFKDQDLNLEKLKPKQRTNQFINFLKNKLNPLRAKVIIKLESQFSLLRSMGAIVHYDPQLDKKEYSILMKINSQENINKLSKTLTELSFKEFNSTLDGDFDV